VGDDAAQNDQNHDQQRGAGGFADERIERQQTE